MRIDFVTLSRSDYASIRPVIKAAHKDPQFNVRVIAGGSHNLKRFGESIQGIKAENYNRLEIISFLNENDDSELQLAQASAKALAEMSHAFDQDKPDRVFIVGDRWEMIPVALAASLLRIPIIHHSGGDITQGSADNQNRYVLTTLSHIHLTALDSHAKRLERMGEEPWRVIATGEPALSELKFHADSIPDIHAPLGLPKDARFVLATFHTVSYERVSAEDQLQVFLQSLEGIEKDIILTAPNPDSGSGHYYHTMKEFAGRHRNIHLFENLGPAKYYAAMSKADYMIGNSSSGLWEAPSFALPVVNIGERQKGRERGKNVIDCPVDIEQIKNAIVKADSTEFKKSLLDCKNPYLKDNTIQSIIDAIKIDIPNDRLLAKILIDPLEFAL